MHWQAIFSRLNLLWLNCVSTLYFLRYAQVKNQKDTKMFAYEYEKQKTAYFSRKGKISVVNNLRILYIWSVKFSEYYCFYTNTDM